MNDPRISMSDRFKMFARNHPEAVMFGFGVLIFAAGLLTVLATRSDSGLSSPIGDSAGVVSKRTSPARTSPERDEPLGAYIDRKRVLLATSAGKEPRKVVQAVISFDAYRKVEDVASFIKSNKVEAVTLHIRIPVSIFEPVELAVGGRSVTDTVAQEIGTERIAELRAELKELESLLKDVNDPAFEAVYREDAEFHRKAIALLKSAPAVIFAVVVKASLGQLAKVASVPGVRLVDLPDPGLTPPEFAGILPEQL